VVQKTLKKSLPKIFAADKPEGNYTQTGKSVDAPVALSLQTQLHT
jgi:hypothetical protein